MTEKTARKVFLVVAGGFVIFNLTLAILMFYGGTRSAAPSPAPLPTNGPATNAEAGR